MKSPADYWVEPLAPSHDRTSFTCGVSALDLYLQRQAQQDAKRRLAAVFVLTPDGKTVSGLYTLSAHSIHAIDLPEAAAKKLPRFPLGVTLLGRMAVALTLKGEGWGEHLLMHALERAWLGAKQVASWAVVVDAKEGARDFYLKYDFQPFPLHPERLFLPMTKIDSLFSV